MEKVKDMHPFGVRMPSELRAWIKETAKNNKRTMNNQIVLFLEKEKALSATNTQSFRFTNHQQPIDRNCP